MTDDTDPLVDPTLHARLHALLSGRVAGISTEQLAWWVRTYFERSDGRWFEDLGRGGDGARVRDQVTATDVLALGALGVRVKPQVASALIDTYRTELTTLLRQVPADLDLWDADAALVAPGGAADRFYEIVRAADVPGTTNDRWVAAMKLCARKRPRLLPVYDRDVRRVVSLHKPGRWWLSLRHALQDEELRTLLGQVRDEACVVPRRVSALRVLDVVLWRTAKAHRDLRLPSAPPAD